MYQITGNEYISLPQIRESDGAVENLTFLYMNAKGMIEMTGKPALIRPYIRIDGKELSFQPEWELTEYWIPTARMKTDQVTFESTYLTPIGEKGFVIHLYIRNNSSHKLDCRIGTAGEWTETNHRVNEKLSVPEGKETRPSGWNHMFVFVQRAGLPLFAFAPITEDNQPFSEINQQADWTLDEYRYDIGRNVSLASGQEAQLDICFGIGFEEVSAATAGKELLRQGYNTLLKRTSDWLKKRKQSATDCRINDILNRNLFFAFFYATGRTVDTEELCMVTSRSPRYYVSAAYWDRDSLLWAFPAVVKADSEYAKELLISIYNRQGRNFGTHSRYIDGTVLEPGFELDELCAPVIALQRYIRFTGDHDILNEAVALQRLSAIEKMLKKKKNSSEDLYETFLQPTDDMHRYPYLTYDNMLVWATYSALAEMLNRPDLLTEADRVSAAIRRNMIIQKNGIPMYAWSSDLNGHWDIYDEPPGSLQLLPWYGFVPYDDPVWLNTMQSIRDQSYELSFAEHPISEIGCKHAPHPWILSICNSMLSGHKDTATEHLKLCVMDNGIACESVHEDNGECMTGAAFATCAGFLAFALMETAEVVS